eukprot:TRINITY_DN2141_c1_g3_i1.p1 TRINITY_DN2141_c1_g3~~TRINITY_DN2141_c1_g3_i1.p1  ORF type:complete len:269 (-),score=14.95 TRINITY_DN2141_c1_g3_i1:383-1189(-)
MISRLLNDTCVSRRSRHLLLASAYLVEALVSTSLVYIWESKGESDSSMLIHPLVMIVNACLVYFGLQGTQNSTATTLSAIWPQFVEAVSIALCTIYGALLVALTISALLAIEAEDAAGAMTAAASRLILTNVLVIVVLGGVGICFSRRLADAPVANFVVPVEKLEGLALRTFVIGETEDNDAAGKNTIAEQTCCICLEELQASEHVAELPCHHYFHKECIESWVSFRSTPWACPLRCIPHRATRRASFPQQPLEPSNELLGYMGADDV